MGVEYVEQRKQNIRSSNNLLVDHCHVTGKYRGLLCNRCNTSLGFVNDDIELLEKMVNYLKEYKQ